ncbi:CocE/NonD family hydrolase [Sabulicella glaciei]|uniref:CocE/NonD family hydrolase n=1 Tax=Sabulicella glaciei TaxID=2984948 RepID=A0ABT3NQF3_9PROT|nr:CocE/NonD family hydrolase [Roseococcus sp. MDT2-1-1]MCW8084394.1 CocE/NonD family hydrolase [Roseococcus sp. MDT2-1-1]
MGDRDAGSAAWQEAPSAYWARRETPFRVPTKPLSRYVTMRDGCRIALDAWLPEGGEGPFPAIVVLTPYYRRFSLEPGSTAEACPNTAKFREAFVPRGYALVVVDVRGTGASFGTRDSFRSPRERDDAKELADWVVAQPWSNGSIGATGISYPGAASDFLASTAHPAVKAIAPLFAVWDTWADHYYPGGLYLNRLAQVYDDLMVAMDHDRRDLLKNFAYFANPDLRGPAPVDDDPDGALCRAAVHEHLGNFRQPDFMADLRFREEALPHDPGFSSASISPYAASPTIPESVAVCCVSGWMDGAGYANSAIARYLTLSRNPRHLLLGPWDHGARCNVSPWRNGVDPEFALLGEVTRFFDEYLMERDTGLRNEAPIHYFAMHEEAWHAADAWPPAPESRRLHLRDGARLEREAGTLRAEVQADFAWGSGDGTRYERIAGINSTTYHADWTARQEALSDFTTAPLDAPLDLAGHVIADIQLECSEQDGALLLYLSEVEADGTVRYVTEGLLRLLHRKEAEPPRTYRCAWPWRSYRREDAAPMQPGQVEHVRLALLPVAWRFKAGSRLRLSIAGHDADHMIQTPHGRPPRFVLHAGSTLDLPLRPGA